MTFNTKATIAFPPGAVAAKAEVTLVPAVESNLQANTGALKSAGKFLTLTAKAGETSLTSVSKTYTITVGYTAADVAGMDESTLGIYWWNGSSWEKEPSSRVDTVSKTVSATPDHLSAFAMLGESSTRAVYLPLVIKSYGAGWQGVPYTRQTSAYPFCATCGTTPHLRKPTAGARGGRRRLRWCRLAGCKRRQASGFVTYKSQAPLAATGRKRERWRHHSSPLETP